MGLIVACDVYVCNEEGCGLRKYILYVKLCRIIMHLFFWQNGTNLKMRFSLLRKVKNDQMSLRGASSLKIARILGFDHRAVECFVVNGQSDPKTPVEEKGPNLTANDLKEPSIFQVCHISQNATYLEY